MTPHVEQLAADVKDARDCPYIHYYQWADYQDDVKRLIGYIKDNLSRGHYAVLTGFPNPTRVHLDSHDLEDKLALNNPNQKYDVHGESSFFILVRVYHGSLDAVEREQDYTYPQNAIILQEFLDNLRKADKIQCILDCPVPPSKKPDFILYGASSFL